MAWRYVASDAVGAADGLAFDEALLLRYGTGDDPPYPATLRLYTYRAHCALVGRYQDVSAEVDLEVCRREGFGVARRPTGGGAIIMGPGQLGVTLAVHAPDAEPPRHTLRRYAEAVVGGLRGLGVEAAFRPKNDLEVGGRKIAGLGLYRDERGAMLFHSSILVDLDIALMLRILRIPGAKLADKGVSRVEQRVTTVSRELGIPLQAVDVRAKFARALAGFAGVTADNVADTVIADGFRTQEELCTPDVAAVAALYGPAYRLSAHASPALGPALAAFVAERSAVLLGA